MELITHALGALSPLNLALALLGVIAGIVIGALPGLSATMAVAVLVPVTFGMAPESALIMLGAIYTGAIYGGSYSAILVNTPGTPSAIATTFDGYPMAQRGDGDLAVTLSTIASVVGGLVGVLALLLLAPLLAQVALSFGPVEYFWLAIFGLTLISALSEDSTLKGFMGAGLGLLLSTVGVAVIGGDIRYTYGMPVLLGGIETVSALIGLYCIPVLIDLVATPAAHLKVDDASRGVRFREGLGEAIRGKWNLLRSATIGTGVAILPGAGGSIASLVSYSEARRVARDPGSFGKGNPQGVLATESANNATVGGGFIPTLVLGIPGTPPDAVILGALLVQGFRTGPELFTTNAGITYTFVAGLFLATCLLLPLGLLIGRYAFKSIIAIPKALLVPTIAFMTVIGTYAIRNSASDVMIMLCLGVVGWVLNRYGFRPSPIVLGLILGPIAEQGFVQGFLMGRASGSVVGTFFGGPISLIIIALSLLSVFYPLVKARRVAKRQGNNSLNEEVSS
ncbi:MULTISPECIES: tripartite tricarboxylate transporter permease [unclassified Halomonas]|uniref:tripartite tricarboxylate transporter permease n=1 Tax=unclassified Halomonas TaxID=2609666 RepID=UPI001C97203E|nr:MULTISPECIES: tripartite tricarboxylate transporter permease [unclassified Halomonas]MBY5924359.1 tripartite tricarboxylate transporter permease [Halomonas sp. DP4Y7-2]MBY6231401.1 tripartite tricarboxylate transporter permease [Halomonas sp. DP4Y7-1]